MLIRKLWAAVKHIPSDYVLADPETGELLSVERERGWLTLVITDPPDPSGPALVTRYTLRAWAAPVPPPLFRHLAGLDDIPSARWRLRQKAWLAHVNEQTGALKVTWAEVAALIEQVGRTSALHLGSRRR